MYLGFNGRDNLEGLKGLIPIKVSPNYINK